MAQKVVWTEPALDDLREAISYIAADDAEAAFRVGDEAVSATEILADFPFIGPVYREKGNGSIREIVSGKYRSFYRVVEARGQVEILSVWHGARGTPRLDI